MANQLILHFDSLTEPEPTISFYQFIDSKLSRQGIACLADLKQNLDANQESETLILIPGEQVISLSIEKPKGSKKNIQQALPYLLEDHISFPIENFHIASSLDSENDRITCALIEKHLIEHLLEKLLEQGIQPRTLIPDYWLADAHSTKNNDNISGLCIGERALLRFKDDTGISLPVEQLPAFLSASHPQDASVFAMDYFETVDESALPALSKNGKKATAQEVFQQTDFPLNLLQGQYKPATVSQFTQWKTAGITFSVCLVLILGYFLAAGWYFASAAKNLDQQATQLYRELFPEDRRIVNLRKQMEAHLNGATAISEESGFFSLLGSLSRAEPIEKSSSSIRHIRYQNNDRTLQLEVQLPSINEANTLKKELDENELSGEILSANTNDRGVLARFKISGGSQ